ncbi:KTSC domain-containing protein [Arachidicoccus sp.]|uniref:KTSC domain-containing protein n=1 Tax=Arachidicoccus sp. TaxID=1872624 RepID=UPI003D24E23B
MDRECALLYSCDGNKGFLIVKLKGKKYIYKDVPKNVWNRFKTAKSFGSYYDHYIKHYYQLHLLTNKTFTQ